MRTRRARRTLLAMAAVAAVAITGLVAVPADASSGVGPDHGSRCITLNYIEKLIKYYPESDHITGTGVFGEYYDEMYLTTTSTDKKATGIGTFDTLYLDPRTGHIMEWVTEQWQFPDGTFVGSGLFDRNEMLAGEWMHTPLVGASGRYLGMKGHIDWRAIDLDKPGNPPAQDVIVLCRG